jgi:uncharacterized membrane protein
MLRKHIFKDKAKIDSIRWRLHEPTRLEAFSDAVIAFAITLVAISLEVPKTFEALSITMKGFYGFGICFLFLVLIWHEQYVFFRRFGLQDTRTTALNLFLLFMVIYLVYPLKFLFTFLTRGPVETLENGQVVYKFTSNMQICELMIIYGVGYFIIYILLMAMYSHALKRKDDILLSRLEVYNARTYIYSYLGCLGVVVISLSLAVTGLMIDNGVFGAFSGMSYGLIGLVLRLIRNPRKRKIPKLFSKAEIDELMNEVVVVEERG